MLLFTKLEVTHSFFKVSLQSSDNVEEVLAAYETQKNVIAQLQVIYNCNY